MNRFTASNRFTALSIQEPKDKMIRKKNREKHKKTKDPEDVSASAVEAQGVMDVPLIDRAATADDDTEIIIQTTRWWNPIHLLFKSFLLTKIGLVMSNPIKRNASNSQTRKVMTKWILLGVMMMRMM
jgi:hypothetical protein